MKQFICFFSGLLLLFTSATHVVAQEVGNYSQLSEDDYSNIVLPPLDVLFENAKNNPIYEMADVKQLHPENLQAYLDIFLKEGLEASFR